MHPADPLSLRLFIAVCECGTIARAAEREFIASSALSKRIADLEESLGVTLLTRSQRGVSPTPAGEELLEHARPILRSLQRLHAEVSQHAQGLRGHVRVLAVGSAMAERLPEDICSFLSNHPQVGITLDAGVNSEVIRSVMSGAADIGICRELTAGRELRAYPFGYDRLAVVVGVTHPLAERDGIDFDETLAYEQVCLSQGSSSKHLADQAAQQTGRHINYRFWVSSPHAALQLIAHGLALGILPHEAVARFVDVYRVRAIPLNDAWAQRRQSICTSAMEPLSPAARRLLQHLLQCRSQTAPAPDD